MLKRWFKFTLLFLGFIGLGFFFSQPLYRCFWTAIPYSGKGSFSPAVMAGDHLQIFYNLWHIARNVAAGKIWDPHEFAVAGSSYSFSFFYFPLSCLLVPVTLLLGPVFAYNFFLVLSFGLCGLFTFLFARQITDEDWGALCAALLVTLCPYRLSQLFGGHSNGFIFFYVPLAFYAFHRGWKILFFIALVGLYCGDLQLLYFFLLLFTPYLFLRLLQQASSWRDFGKKTLPYLVCFAAIFGFYLWGKRAFLCAALQTGGRRIEEIGAYSWINFFRKSPRSVEGNLYVGVALLSLIGLGMAVFLWRWKKNGRLPLSAKTIGTAGYFAAAGGLALCLSLGFSVDRTFPLYRWFYQYVPHFSFCRTPTRLFLIGEFFLALLAGGAFSFLIRSLSKRQAAVCGMAAIGLILWDTHCFKKVAFCRMDNPPPAYQILAEKPDKEGKMVLLPIFPHGDHFVSLYEYAVTATGRKMLQGYSVLPPLCCGEIEKRLEPLHHGNLTPELIAYLREQRVEYILFHPSLYGRRKGFPNAAQVRERLLASPYLTLEKTPSDVLLFRVFKK